MPQLMPPKRKSVADYKFQALGENRFELSGELNFTSVPELLEQAAGLMSDGQAATIDLAKVSSANSAAMALLIEWKSVAAQNNTEVAFLNIPKQIERLAEVCKVESLLLG